MPEVCFAEGAVSRPPPPGSHAEVERFFSRLRLAKNDSRIDRHGVFLMMNRPIQLAQIGCGYWGPNLLRNFSAL
jgi:hypothetical protein